MDLDLSLFNNYRTRVVDMVTNRWIFRVLGVTFAPGNGEDFGWGSTPPQTSSFPSTSTKQLDINLPSAVSAEQEFFISPNRFALLAFVIAGILTARKQSQS